MQFHIWVFKAQAKFISRHWKTIQGQGLFTNQSSAALRIVCAEGGENDAFLKGYIHKGNSNKDKALS